MQKKYVPLVLLFTALLMLVAHLGTRALASEPTFAFAQDKCVYLTFDDGPSTVVTGKILDTLHQEGIRATFFVVSDRVPGREETLRRIAAEGHTLGVHSASHRYAAIYASDEALLEDVTACSSVIARVTGILPTVYRFPGGGAADPSTRRRQTALLEGRGYTVVRWNAVCGDEEIRGATAEVLVKESLRTANGRSRVVLLLHDSAPHRATAEALPAIIAAFRERGYRFCAF